MLRFFAWLTGWEKLVVGTVLRHGARMAFVGNDMRREDEKDNESRVCSSCIAVYEIRTSP